MLLKNVAPETLRAISSAISSWDPASDFSVPAAFDVESVPELTPIMDEDSSIPTAELEVRTAKKKRGEQAALGSELLGENPKESRARIREGIPQGFYICLSGKRSIVTVLISTICVGPIPVLICPSPQSMTWYVHYAHVKGLPHQH